MEDIRKKFEKHVKDGEFSKAKELSSGLSQKAFEDALFSIAFDTDSITSYAFVCYLLCQKETVYLHRLASEILEIPFAYIEGSASSTLYHSRRVVELEPNNLTLKGYLLACYEMPLRIISLAEAKKIAQEILAVDPTHKHAQKIMAIREEENK